ncbi:MAG: hypothetical protein IKL52_01085, partial [Candidatus Gastranaerophilales bacterium]|nr:hypothetical protein [Candidatus Gastranaerophilales bacterium]
MFGSIFRLFMDVVRKVKEEHKKEDSSTKPQDKNDGVFDVVDTPKVDEFEPSATPETTEPIVTEPVITEPAVTEPLITEPVITEPVITEPVVTEPVVTEPV